MTSTTPRKKGSAGDAVVSASGPTSELAALRAKIALKCDSCSEPYDTELRQPRALPCGHSFCENCVDSLIQKGHHGASASSSVSTRSSVSVHKLFRCPSCRFVVSAPDKHGDKANASNGHSSAFVSAKSFPLDHTKVQIVKVQNAVKAKLVALLSLKPHSRTKAHLNLEPVHSRPADPEGPMGHLSQRFISSVDPDPDREMYGAMSLASHRAQSVAVTQAIRSAPAEQEAISPVQVQLIRSLSMCDECAVPHRGDTTTFCHQCGYFLCDFHTTNHQRTVNLHTHSLFNLLRMSVSTSKLTHKDIAPMLDAIIPPDCPAHNQPCETFCKLHGVLVCQDCIRPPIQDSSSPYPLSDTSMPNSLPRALSMDEEPPKLDQKEHDHSRCFSDGKMQALHTAVDIHATELQSTMKKAALRLRLLGSTLTALQSGLKDLDSNQAKVSREIDEYFDAQRQILQDELSDRMRALRRELVSHLDTLRLDSAKLDESITTAQRVESLISPMHEAERILAEQQQPQPPPHEPLVKFAGLSIGGPDPLRASPPVPLQVADVEAHMAPLFDAILQTKAALQTACQHAGSQVLDNPKLQTVLVSAPSKAVLMVPTEPKRGSTPSSGAYLSWVSPNSEHGERRGGQVDTEDDASTIISEASPPATPAPRYAGVTMSAYSSQRLSAPSIRGVSVRKWGSLGSALMQFSSPCCITYDPSHCELYVSDWGNDRVQVFDRYGKFLRTWGSSGSGPGQFNHPMGIAVDINGSDTTVAVADRDNHRIQLFDRYGKPLRQWGAQGKEQQQLSSPRGLCIDSATGLIFVCDSDNNRIQVFDRSGAWIRGWGAYGSGPGQFRDPRGIAFDASSGQIFVADDDNHRLQAFDRKGTFLLAWGGEGTDDGKFDYPRGIAVDDKAGLVYVCDRGGQRVQIFTRAGEFVGKFGREGQGDGEINCPIGIALDTQHGECYVCEWRNHRIQVFQ